MAFGVYKSVYKSINVEVNRAGATCGATYAWRGPYAARLAYRLPVRSPTEYRRPQPGLIQIRGIMGVMSHLPQREQFCRRSAQPRGLNPPTDRRLQARARFDA